MSDDNSNDVIMVESVDDGSNSFEGASTETRPIMLLFHRLISNDNKENTVLTNAQIISILNKEFNIDISTMHELEVDIHLNIVKRFLKDWPLWDEFDRGINFLRKQKAHTSIQKTLERKYTNLKRYLQVQIDATRPLAEEAVNKIVNETTKKMEKVNTSDIALEIYCTRKQLNELIFSQPNSECNIFNVPEYNPNTIPLTGLPVESILNWWGVRVMIEMKSLSYSRSTMHQLKHVLVNQKNGPRILNQPLNNNVQIKDQKRSTDNVDKTKIFTLLNSVLEKYKSDSKMYQLIDVLFSVIFDDLKMVDESYVKVPGTYRQHSNKYRYYRKLHKANKTKSASSSSGYELYIEETLAPMHVFYIGKVGPVETNIIPHNYAWLTIECSECKKKFTGVDLYTLMKEHYDAYHTNEPYWNCTNCERTFTMMYLTENRWYHDCNNS